MHVWTVKCTECGQQYEQNTDYRPWICGACGSDKLLTGEIHKQQTERRSLGYIGPYGDGVGER